MITEEIVDAMDTMIDQPISILLDARSAMRSMRDMLCDFDYDHWQGMNEEERAAWVGKYL